MEALNKTQTDKPGLSVGVIVTMVVYIGLSGLLLTDRSQDYPELHILLDTSIFLLSGILTLFFWNLSIRQAGLANLLAASFAITSLLEFIHAITGWGWSGVLAFISHGDAFRPGTWPPPAYLLPLAIGYSIWTFRPTSKQKRSGGFILPLMILGIVLLTVFHYLPRYTDATWLGMRRPTLILVPLLWIMVGLACWQRRAEYRLLPALALMAAVLFSGQVAMLYSGTRDDPLSMVAHLSKLGGYLLLLLSMMQLASEDMIQRLQAEAQLRRLNTDLEQHVLKRTAQLETEIMERKQAEEQSRENEQKFSTLFRKAPYVVQLARMPDGVIVDVNEEFENLLGYSRQEAVGRTSLELNLYPDPGIRSRSKAEVDARGSARNVETVLRTKSGDLRSVLASTDILEVAGTKYRLVTGKDNTERKQVEAEIATLAKFPSENPNPVLRMSNDGILLYANGSSQPLLTHWKSAVNSKLPAHIQELVSEVLQVGQPKEVEIECESRVFSFVFVPIAEAGYVNGYGRDMTERTQAEARIQYQATLLANVNDGIVASDMNGRITNWNAAATEIYGWLVDEVLGQSVNAILQTEYEAGTSPEQVWQKFLTEGAWRGEVTQKRKDGTSISILAAVALVRDQSGTPTAMVAVNRDITERKQAEDALRIENERFTRFVESNIVGIVIADASGKIITANDYYLRLLGLTRQDFLDGKVDWIKFTPPEWLPVDEKAIQELREIGLCKPYEKEYERADGTRVPVYIADAMLPGTEEQIAAFVLDFTERKQAEAQITDLLAFNEKVINHSPVGILIYKLSGECIVANENASSIIGAGIEKLKAQNFRTIESWKKSGLHDLVEQAITSRSPVTADVHLISTFGKDLWLTACMVIFQAKEEDHLLLTFSDITERKRAEEALSQSEKRFRALTENISDVIAMIDQEGLITYASPGISRVLGYAAGELVGQNEFGLVHPDDLEMVKQNLKRVLDRHGASVSFLTRERHKDGSWRWVEGVGTNLLEEPGVGGIVVNFRDVTERLEAQAKIKHQLERLKALRTIDMAISTSFDMKLSLTVLLNQAMMQLGVSAAAILLYNPNTLMLEYAVGKGFISSAIEKTHLRMGEGLAGRAALERHKIRVENLAEAGDRYTRRELLKEEGFASYYATPLIAKGELKGVLEVFDRAELHPNQEWLDFVETLAGQAAIAVDNSSLFINLQNANAELEQRVAERTAELNQTNAELERANRSKDEFLANMSHELRTPLNVILGLSEVLLEHLRGPLTEPQEKALHLISSSGQHLLGLINDILDVSKVEAGKLQIHPDVISVKELCESSLNFVRELALKKSISLDYWNSEAIKSVYADPQRLKQILVNLLNNAVKFTPEKGNVSLEVEVSEERDRIQFIVTDTGIGISTEDLQKLFKPFTQLDSSLSRQHDGTGLGLVLVYKFTELHGGSVRVESAVGTGSRFTIVLPWSETPSTTTDPDETVSVPVKMEPEQPTSPAGSPSPVLLVEDNESNIPVVSDYLQEQGLPVALAHNGFEALDQAGKLSPSLILMDIQMPEMDGMEAIRHLRANPRFATTPIIALTALAMPGDRERCLEAGASEYMSKPVSLKKLLHTIKEMLGREG